MACLQTSDQPLLVIRWHRQQQLDERGIIIWCQTAAWLSASAALDAAFARILLHGSAVRTLSASATLGQLVDAC